MMLSIFLHAIVITVLAVGIVCYLGRRSPVHEIIISFFILVGIAIITHILTLPCPPTTEPMESVTAPAPAPIQPTPPPPSNQFPELSTAVPDPANGATEDDKAKLHASIDKYDYLKNKDYDGRDTLYYANKGDLVDSKWTNQFSILDSKHWKPYKPPPPVCIGANQSCEPCPVTMHMPYLNLTDFEKTNIIVPKLVSR